MATITRIAAAAACLASTGLVANQPVVPPHLGGIDTLPAATFRENLAVAIRIHRAADAARVTRAVADAFDKVGYAGLGPRAAAILEAARRDPRSEAGDVLRAVERIGGKWAGGQSEVAKQYYATFNAYGRAYAMGPAGVPLLGGNPRPWQVTPLITRDARLGADYSFGSPAYPSGHTTDDYAQSLVLALAFPERAQPILARASDYAESRIVLGVHYPLDVMGGRILATGAILRLLNERSIAFGIARPRGLAAATAILRAELARRCGSGVPLCDSPYGTRVPDRASYRTRLTYDLAPVGATDAPPVVPPGAERMLATRFPYLDPQQRRDVLATTEIRSGYPLDDGSGFARLDLFAAAGGYGAFTRTVTVRMPGGHDVFSNDIGGIGGLTKAGKGTLELTGRNTFAGGLTIRAGTLASHADGLGRGPIRNDAALRLDVQVDARVTLPITGIGRIVKIGAGTLELTAVGDFRGVITVNGGQVVLRCPSGQRDTMRRLNAGSNTRVAGRRCRRP